MSLGFFYLSLSTILVLSYYSQHKFTWWWIVFDAHSVLVRAASRFVCNVSVPSSYAERMAMEISIPQLSRRLQRFPRKSPQIRLAHHQSPHALRRRSRSLCPRRPPLSPDTRTLWTPYPPNGSSTSSSSARALPCSQSRALFLLLFASIYARTVGLQFQLQPRWIDIYEAISEFPIAFVTFEVWFLRLHCSYSCIYSALSTA